MQKYQPGDRQNVQNSQRRLEEGSGSTTTLPLGQQVSQLWRQSKKPHPMKQQHQAPPANNPVGSTGANFQYFVHFQQPSLQQHSQQSQSTVGSSTPMLMVNNTQYQQGLQGQPKRQPVPPVQQVNQQVRPPTPQTFNQQYNQYQVPQASSLLAQPQYNPQIPPSYPGQWQQQAPSV